MLRVLVGLLFLSLVGAVADDLVLGDFEKAVWPGLVRDREVAKVGKASGRWENLAEHSTIRIPDLPTDCSPYRRLVFWLHSAKANGQKLTLVCNSENPANGAKEWDYYFLHFTVNWTGWKKFDLAFDQDIVGTREPLGWQHIDYCSFHADGWTNTPLPDTVLRFDDVRLVAEGAKAPALALPKCSHPFLLGGPEVYQRAKDRARRFDWAKEQVAACIKRADAALADKVDIPAEGGQWSHHYVCKACGGRLKPVDGKHVCQKCGKSYTGWPYDQVLVGYRHGRYWSQVRDLGLGYALTGKEAYAEHARQILLGYAAVYKSLPLHNSQGKVSNSGARIYAQTLDEAVAATELCWGYDLVYSSPCFSAADHRAIATDFLREVAATIRRNRAGISNWQSWHNAGIGAIGFCLQDVELVSLALRDARNGFEFQLGNSILPDGFWYEGTAAYHYYALDALKWTAEFAHFAGMEYWQDPRFQSLFDAPLQYTFPDLTFPAVNDSDVFSLRGRHALYELAYARTQRPEFLTVAQFGDRRSLEALLWGPDELPAAPTEALASRDFPGLGAVVLRQGEGDDQLYVHLDYGPHGGGHGHPDKLALILFGLGKQLAPDPARLAYGAPLHGSWYRQTFAHNTVCVDQRSQAATTGTLEFTRFTDDLAVGQASTDQAYPGALLRRRVALFGGMVLDVFEATSAEEHTYDYLYHNFGTVEPDLKTAARNEPLGSRDGYQHLKDIQAATTGNDWSVTFAQDQANVRLLVLGEPDTELYFGTGMANNPPVPCPMAVVRRRGKATRFVALIEPYRDQPTVTGFRQAKTPDGILAFEILRGSDRYRLVLRDDRATLSHDTGR